MDERLADVVLILRNALECWICNDLHSHGGPGPRRVEVNGERGQTGVQTGDWLARCQSAAVYMKRKNTNPVVWSIASQTVAKAPLPRTRLHV